MKLIKTKTASSFLFRVDFWFLAKKSVCVVSVPWNTFCSSLLARGGGGSHHFSCKLSRKNCNGDFLLIHFSFSWRQGHLPSAVDFFRFLPGPLLYTTNTTLLATLWDRSLRNHPREGGALPVSVQDAHGSAFAAEVASTLLLRIYMKTFWTKERHTNAIQLYAVTVKTSLLLC